MNSVEKSLKEACIGISERYEVRFVEIGIDEDHVHFFVQSAPVMSVTKLVKLLKGLTARRDNVRKIAHILREGT